MCGACVCTFTLLAGPPCALLAARLPAFKRRLTNPHARTARGPRPSFRSWLHLPREAPKELADILEEALPLRSTSK